MKPLPDESKRLIEEATAADTPGLQAQSKIWHAIEHGLQQPLTGVAAEAAQSFAAPAAGTTVVTGLGAKLIIVAIATASTAAGVAFYVSTTDTPVPHTVAPASNEIKASATEMPEPVAEAPDVSALSEEARLVAAAQRALASADAKRALALLAEHEQRFPNGQLQQERAAAHVLALCADGQFEAAERAGGSFLQRWPSSPLSARVRSACE